MNARGLLAPAVGGWAEWGVSAALRYDSDPASDRGASFTVSPAWGSASSGGLDALWSRAATAGRATHDATDPGGRLDAEFGYGHAVLAAGTPWGGVSLSVSSRSLHLGYRLRLDASFGLNIEGARRERAYANAAPEHRIMLQGSRQW